MNWDRKLNMVEVDEAWTARRRLKLFQIAAEAIVDLCLERDPPVSFTTVRGIPPDAQVLTVHYDPRNHCFMLLVQHPSFEIVPWGNIIPTSEVTVLTQARTDLLVADMPRTQRKDANGR